MKLLWLFSVIYTAAAYIQTDFGTSYLRKSKVCNQWTCLNTKLGFPDGLPTAEQSGAVLRSILPPDWHSIVDNVLNICYNDRPRRYSNTCPGQAIMHCAVDQLIANCPESYQNKVDACAPINSLAGFQNMFTQSRYENMKINMVVDRRPAWFLKNYFSTKCCNLPPLFNATVLSECGFSNIIQYYVHNPTVPSDPVLPQEVRYVSTTPANNGDSLNVVNLEDLLAGNTPITADPLDCCDSKFIKPSWRHECNFDVSWSGQNRLVINNKLPVFTTTTEMSSTSRPVLRKDVVIVPETCEKETCVFTKLNIIKNGTVDVDAFTRLLDNLTSRQPSWTKSKGRALTTCIRKPVTKYEDLCEINKILACTFDVLTENCPNATKNDECKHTATEKTCQISSSKYRPKHRREVCPLPELVERSVLTECGLTSISKTEPITVLVKPKSHKLVTSKNKCKELTPSSSCLLSKMGVLNKYGFLDYFKMKDRIRNYTADTNPLLESVFMNAFNMDLLYTEHCNSPKKLLNLLDSILVSCPQTRREDTAQCARIFDEVNNRPVQRKATREFSRRILNHFSHVFNPSPRRKVFHPRHMRKTKKTPLYRFGILNDDNAPKVTTIAVNHKLATLVENQPLVLLPVYLRVPQSNLMIRPFMENNVMRSAMNLTTQAQNTIFPNLPTLVTTAQPISTTQKISTIDIATTIQPLTTTKHFSSRFVSSKAKKLA